MKLASYTLAFPLASTLVKMFAVKEMFYIATITASCKVV